MMLHALLINFIIIRFMIYEHTYQTPQNDIFPDYTIQKTTTKQIRVYPDILLAALETIFFNHDNVIPRLPGCGFKSHKIDPFLLGQKCS